jgi:hypothetical protein
LPVIAGFRVRGEAKNCEKLGSWANAVLASVPYIVTVKSSLFIYRKIRRWKLQQLPEVLK